METHKTVGPEKFVVPEGLGQQQPEAPRPTGTVTQAELAEVARLKGLIAELEAELTTMQAGVVKRLADGCPWEAGLFTASVKTNFKGGRVNWKDAYIGAMGADEAAELEKAAKLSEKEVSSRTLVLGRTDGEKI